LNQFWANNTSLLLIQNCTENMVFFAYFPLLFMQCNLLFKFWLLYLLYSHTPLEHRHQSWSFHQWQFLDWARSSPNNVFPAYLQNSDPPGGFGASSWSSTGQFWFSYLKSHVRQFIVIFKNFGNCRGLFIVKKPSSLRTDYGGQSWQNYKNFANTL
jgi:hypothetical protein